ncbi:MAG TPA: hypothetical protein VGN69_01155 [Solirubrobacteraceae bacterium]|nr:hypothetical protein [Solirubrobacteraceae bacterium]
MAPLSRPTSPARQAASLRESLRLATDLAEALTTQAARVKRQCQELAQALEHMPELPEVEVAPAEESTPASPNGPAEENPARLAAMEMALQGASRAQIDTYLRENLKLSDTSAILDDVLSGRTGS